uniref:Uncharacterized protein n=1 Tax=Rhizophora mucronata TaxID=61149 RepID=A0A2P2QHE3_RHIMU
MVRTSYLQSFVCKQHSRTYKEEKEVQSQSSGFSRSLKESICLLAICHGMCLQQEFFFNNLYM